MSRIPATCLCALLCLPALSDEEATPEPLMESADLSGVRSAAVKLAVVPNYPARALKKKIDGEVTIEFMISRYGRALEPRIVSATPRKVFDKEVLDTIRYWIFEPARPLNCGTLAQPASQTFRFRHDAEQPIEMLPIVIEGVPTLPREQRVATSTEEVRLAEAARRAQSQTVNPRGLIPVKRVEPVYPEEALRRSVEGVVSVSFVIETDGTVSEPVVVDAVKGSVFKGVTLRALKQWQFEPSYRDGAAELRTGCHEFIFLADEYKRRQADRKKREKSNIRVFETN